MDTGITITVGAPGETSAGASGGTIAKYGIGKKCRGRVVNFKPYGFFVETDDGGFGLVHGRNIRGWVWGNRFDRVFRHGSEIEVTVIDIEEATNRMSFSCEMPSGAVSEPAEERQEEEPAAPAISRQEIARKWADENPDKSEAALAWLRAELADGPIYGPLTNVLCDRFGVPVPASRWILLFSEFTCYTGRGDNPSDLPAVALSERAGEVAYWDRIKIRTDDLLEARNRQEDDTARLGTLAKRLDGSRTFPGAKWILGCEEQARTLIRGKGVYGASDTAERLAIPLLGQLGWDVSDGNAAFVRGDGSTFDVRIYGGTASSGKVALALKCAPVGSALQGADVERVLGLYNQLGGDDPLATRIVWTNGVEWIVFTRELLKDCIGILADHRGERLLAEPPAGLFRKVAFPTDGTPFGWLAAFADLYEAIGC